jgi:hypothetical protein
VVRWVLLIAASLSLARAHEPITTKLTWTREVSRIVFRRCVSCHREGGKAPMSLVTYEEARPWAKAIKEEVLERRMPPWGPVKGFGEFRHDASLSDVEIAWLVEWVEGGAPNGEQLYLPPVPVAFPPPDPAPAAEPLPLRGAVTLARKTIALGIEAAGDVQVTARRPDGSVEPLIWIRNYRPDLPKTFYFREPLEFPKGTEIRLAGGPTASLLIAASKPAK